MKKTLMKLVGLALFAIPLSHFAQTYQLVPATTFGGNGDGSIRPGERDYITGTNALQRGLAFNPATGNLIIANRSPVSAPTLNRIDAFTGEDRGGIAFEPLVLGGNTSFYLNRVGVADDGSIFVANLTSASTPAIQYALYRYDSESGEQTMVYFGDPSNGAATSSQNNGRWGDTMAVRGSGMDTQILIGSAGTLVAILRPNGSMTSFTATTLSTTLPSGTVGTALCFGSEDTFWAKSGAGTLHRVSFDLSVPSTTLLNTYPSTSFPTRVGSLFNLTASNLLAGIEIVPGADLVKLYNVTDPSVAPIFLDNDEYATNLPNAVSGGAICFGNGRFYTLDSDNGVMAFDLVQSSDPVRPSFFLNPAGGNFLVGTNITLNTVADGVPVPSIQWYFNETNLIADATNTTLALLNVQTSDSGRYSAVATSIAGSATSTVATVTILPSSVLYLYEPFNYEPVGTIITNFTLAPGQTWTNNGTTANDNRVASGSLDITGLPASNGNSLTNGGGGPAAWLPMGVFQNSGSLYASFAMRMNSIGTTFTGTGLIASFVDKGANDQQCRLLVQKDGTGYKIGVSKVTTAAGVYAPTVFSEGDTVFVVLRYTWVPGSTTNDQVSLWLNPDSSTFGNEDAPTPTVSATLAGTDATLLDTIAFRQNSSANTPANLQYDEIRIANKWELVTPASAVEVPLSLTIARQGGNVLLSWPLVGSTGYVLQSAPELNGAIGWSAVSEPVVVSGDQNTVSLGAGGARGFYRLIK